MSPRLALLCCMALALPALALGSTANNIACGNLAVAMGWKAVTPVNMAAVPEGYCATQWASGLDAPRGMIVLPDSKGVLVVEKGDEEVRWLNDTNGDGSVDMSTILESFTILDPEGVSGDINHGIVLSNDRTTLYVSTASTVLAYAFNINAPSARLTDRSGVVIVRNIPTAGHVSRTLTMDANGFLYVSVGSNANVEDDRSRALVKRYNLGLTPSGGYDYTSSNTNGQEVFAAGLRNEVGLAWDPAGNLWGVENGVDQLTRSDLGGDISTDNPGEEIHKFDMNAQTGNNVDVMSNRFFGYPYCFSQGIRQTQSNGLTTQPGSQYAHPNYINDGTHNDAWCRNTANNIPPRRVMQAHTAPLDLEFYPGQYTNVAFQSTQAAREVAQPFAHPPPATSGQRWLYVAQHGSWNRQPAVGYKLLRFAVSNDATAGWQLTSDDSQDMVRVDPTSTMVSGSETTNGWLRPVDIATLPDGTILMSSDASNAGQIVALRYVGNFGLSSSAVQGSSEATNQGQSNNPVNAASAASAPAALMLILAALTAMLRYMH